MADLSVLDNVSIASPCHESWDDMVGDHKIRFCRHCKLNVYNLSAMTRADAHRLVQLNEGRICARFYRRADGTMLTQDCPDGRFRIVRKMTLLALGAAACPAFAGGVYHFFNSLEARAKQQGMRKPNWVTRLEKRVSGWLKPQYVTLGRVAVGPTTTVRIQSSPATHQE